MSEQQRSKYPVSLQGNVILSMIIVTVLSLGVIAFRYKTQEPCTPGVIKATSNSEHSHENAFHAGEPIRFSCASKKDETYEWTFGDDAMQKIEGPVALYSFAAPGKYTVILTVNGNCTTTKEINVVKAPVATNPLLIPKFLCPQTAEVGKPVTFKDSTTNANSWEWRFGESSSVDATTPVATYTYNTPGYKTVVLVVNGKLESSGSCKIYVSPKSTPNNTNQPKKQIDPSLLPVIKDKPDSKPLNESTAAPDLPPAQCVDLMMQVLKHEKNMDAFSPYFCGNTSIPVTYNDQNMTFDAMMAELGKVKVKKIKDIIIVRMDKGANNCITSLVIKARIKTGLF